MKRSSWKKKVNNDEINFKERLEKKLYLAQENPEPVFDLSSCNLKIIPSNVFILCKVLRKEALHLESNNLSNLGGDLKDLKNLRILDISSNKFTKLPSTIGELESLEVFDVSKNQLVELPQDIGNLKKLVWLNLSHNDLHQIPSTIGNCKNLEILKLRNNRLLKKLPDTLGRLHSLMQLDIDSTITYPPNDVCEKGVNEILKYFSEKLNEEVPSTSNMVKYNQNVNVNNQTPDFKNLQEKLRLHEELKQRKQEERLRFEKDLLNQKEKEVEIIQRLQGDKRKLLEDVKRQQTSLDAELAKIQERQNVNRVQLIQICLDEEKKSDETVGKILGLKQNLFISFSNEWESRKKLEELLWTRTAESKALEKREILVSMEKLMKEEIMRAQNDYAGKQKIVDQNLVTDISEQNAAFENLLKKREKNNADLLDTLHRDEELQKQAVASLLEKSDAASWELSRQVAIVEEQLSELTRLELSKKKLQLENQVTNLSENRIALTELLMELFDRQAERRKQLIETIRKMEVARGTEKDSETFWMEQYYKLLNSKSHEMVKFLEAVDPNLVSELFLNGVFHYLPFLKDAAFELGNLNVAILTELGITSAEDRRRILSSISSYLNYKNSTAPSAPLLEEPTAPPLFISDTTNLTSTYLVSDECVVCFEKKPDVVFVPCGHICCCGNCFESITMCPLCRQPISAAHKKTLIN